MEESIAATNEYFGGLNPHIYRGKKKQNFKLIKKFKTFFPRQCSLPMVKWIRATT